MAKASGSVPVPLTRRSKPSPSTSPAVPVARQAGDHAGHGRLADAQSAGQLALGHPVTLGDVQQHEEAHVGELAAPAREQRVGAAVHQGDDEVELVGE